MDPRLRKYSQFGALLSRANNIMRFLNNYTGFSAIKIVFLAYRFLFLVKTLCL